jgi:hypothetical protein
LIGACNYFTKGINLHIKMTGVSPQISPQKRSVCQILSSADVYAKRRQHAAGFTFGSVFEMLQMCVWLKALKGVAVSPLTQKAKSGSISRFYLGLISKATQRTEREMNAPAAAGQLKRRASELAHSKV